LIADALVLYSSDGRLRCQERTDAPADEQTVLIANHSTIEMRSPGEHTKSMKAVALSMALIWMTGSKLSAS
jgi:hypothetical protein